MVAKDYYQILGLARNTTADQIKHAYRKLAMQYHPDRNPCKEEWANEKFKEINEAFSILGDPEQRKEYDQFGTVGTFSDLFSSQATRATFEDLMNDFGEADLGFDLLDDIFGDVLKGRRFSFRTFGNGSRVPRGIRFETAEGINLEDIFCQGQGIPARDARYKIIISKEQAAQGLEKDLVRKGKRLKIKIPAGVKPGSEVRLRNALQVTDDQPGDILIQIIVE